MKLDMRPMLRGECDRIAVDFRLPPFEINGAVIDGDVKIVGDIVDTAGYMRLSLIAASAQDASLPLHRHLRTSLSEPL